jgi:hypothetical protein
MVLPLKRVTAEVFSSDPKRKPKLTPETRKDSAVHVSLSSSSLVKQPGTGIPLSSNDELRSTLLDGNVQPGFTGCAHSS